MKQKGELFGLPNCSKMFSLTVNTNIYTKMIALDYVKLSLTNINTDRLLRLDGLDFIEKHSKTTGEIFSDVSNADYNHCEIKIIYPKGGEPFVQFSGSIHKMWNEVRGIKAPNYKPNKKYNGYNGNYFTYTEFCNARIHLAELFQCDPKQMVFHSIELGMNIQVPFLVQDYLKGLLYHKNIEFEHKHNKGYFIAKHSNYAMKLYNKSAQYNMQGNVIRIETKIIKMRELKRKALNIQTLADINEYTLNKAVNMLIKRFDEIMHFDYTIDKKTLLEVDKRKLTNYSNIVYWMDTPAHRRDRLKKYLKNIINNHSENLSEQIKTLMK